MLIDESDPEFQVGQGILVLLIFFLSASQKYADLVWEFGEANWIDLYMPVNKVLSASAEMKMR